MAEIYKCAEEVIVWLGPGSPRTRKIFNAVSSLDPWGAARAFGVEREVPREDILQYYCSELCQLY